MNNMMGVNPSEFQPVGIGNQFLSPPPQMPAQKPQGMDQGKKFALMQALNQGNKGGGWASVIPQIAGAYMMSKGGFGG